MTTSKTCRDHNCAPVCPHIVISPTLDQSKMLCDAVTAYYIKGGITGLQRDDLLDMIRKSGSYREAISA